MYHIRSILFALKFIVALLQLRPFGSLIHNISDKYELLSVVHLRKFEKVTQKCRKAELDINFLKNCRVFRVFPKFLLFPVPQPHVQDVVGIRKKLLKNAIQRRVSEKCQHEIDRSKQEDFIRNIVSAVDYYILKRALDRNIAKFCASIIQTHEKKMSDLTRNHAAPFTAADVIQNKCPTCYQSKRRTS